MRHALADPLVMLAELAVKPDRLEEFLAYTTESLAASRAYPGNIQFEILLDEVQPARVVFYEVWESRQAQQDYMAWRIAGGDLTKLLSMLIDKPRFTALRSVAA